MKILHVISTLQTGGAEHLMVDLLPALRDLGNEVELLLINGQKTPFYKELESKGIIIHKLQENGRMYSPSHIFKVKKYLKLFDVIHTHTSPCQFLFSFAKMLYRSKTPMVTTEHSTTNHRRGKPFLKPFDRLMYKQYKMKICISKKSLDNLAAHLGSYDGLIEINNGINFNKFTHTIKESLPVTKTIIMVASMRDAKDQDTVIKAMTLLDDKYILKLVGDGPRKQQLQQLCEKINVANKVIFMGNRTDIPELLRESDFVVLSSHWEGLSLACIEGMASGRPFLASDVQGLGEIVREYGIVFPEGDYKSLSKEIIKLSEDSIHYKVVAEKCIERAKEFDINIMANKYNNIYQSL